MVRPHRYRIAISREGWCYLGVISFIFLGALIRDINLLVLLFGLLVGPLFFSWIAVVMTLRAVRVGRQLPREAVAGEPFEVRLSLANGKRRFGSWGIGVNDRIERESSEFSPALHAGVYFLRTSAKETEHGTYRLCLGQRGRYRLGPLVASTRFPLGLIRRSMTFDDRTTITVLPKLGSMKPGWSRPNPAVAQASRRTDRRRGMLEGDFLGLREWRPGDSGRWIHWRTSARRGELMVRQFERHQNHDLAILVDLWQAAEPSAQDVKNVELAVSLAATMVREMCRLAAGQVWITAAGRELTHLGGTASLALFRDAIEGLALLEAAEHERFDELLTRVAREIPASARTILISTRGQALEVLRGQLDAGNEQLDEVWHRIETIDVGSEGFEPYFQPARELAR